MEVQDRRRVVRRAQRHGRRVVLGGHSLGGSITTAYAHNDPNSASPVNEFLANLIPYLRSIG